MRRNLTPRTDNEFLVLPPEASASWVLKDSILCSLLKADKIFIDIQDILC